MTFIKYTHDGKAVIQPAALILSNLDREETLEMHTLEKAIVLLKEKMTPVEKVETACGLMRLINSLSADLMCGFDEDTDESDEDACGDVISIPIEAFEDAGIWGEDLRIRVIDGAVVITADDESDAEPSETMQAVSKHIFEAAVSLTRASDLLHDGDADA